jgi:hypothetical protein
MISLMINATNFTELSKILCIFVEISERILHFILDFFSFGKKIEELDPRVYLSQRPLFQQINWGLRQNPNTNIPSSFYRR